MNLRKMKEEYYKYFTELEAMEAVKQDGLALQYVKESCMTEAMCMEAVKQNFRALQYVKEGCLSDTKTIIIDGKEIEISAESFYKLKDSLNKG